MPHKLDLTADSIFVWKIPFTDIIKSSIKINLHISWVQIASILDGFVVLILLSNFFCCVVSFLFNFRRSPLTC